MSTDLTQTLGLDATQALSALTQLDGALATLEARMTAAAATMRQFNTAGNSTSQLLSRLASDATKAAAALNSLGGSSGTGKIQGFAAAYQNVGAAVNTAAAKVAAGSSQIVASTADAADKGKANTDRLTTSLKLLSRITFTQAVVRALSTLRNTLKDVAGEAVDFQKKVALIQTIDQSGQSADQLKNSIRSLSDAFNVPQLEVADALYQTISNQIGEAGQSVQFLTEALKFARATNSNAADSVDLLSGALKSFNLDIDQTARVATTAFKTIDLGRISADRLANTLGRVAPQAGALGLNFEELGAAIAAISIKGSSSNESLTQFRGILTALVKPTDAMKATIASLGFSSSQAAIQTLGLTGVLKALADSTGGSNEAFAKLFPNVRGFSGAISLTADNVKTLAADLEEMQSAASKTNTDKFLVATATDAERVTSDINKLKNALTDELGQAFLKAAVDASDFIGGIDGLVSLIKVSPRFVIGLAESLGSLAVAFGAARLAGVGLTPVVGLLLAIPAAFGAGKSLSEFLDTKIAEAAFSQVNEQINKDQEQLAEFKNSTKETLDEALKADEERVQSARNAAREITAEYNNQISDATSQNKRFVSSLKSDADDIVTAYRKLSNAVGSAIADATKSKEDSLNQIGRLEGKQAQALLQGQLAGLTNAQKVYALAQQSAQLASKGAGLIASSSGNASQKSQGRQQSDLAQQLAAQEVSLAKQVGDRSLIAKATGDLTAVQNQQINAEKLSAAAEDARAAKLAKAKASIDATTKALQDQFKILLANSGARNKEGKQFSDAEQAQRAAAREAASNQIAKLSLNNSSLSQLSQLGLGAAIAKLGTSLNVAPLKLAFDADAGITRVQSKITQAFVNFKVKLGFDTGSLENLLGTAFSNPADIFKGLDQAKAEAAAIQKQLADNSTSNLASAQLRGQIAQLRDVALNAKPNPNSFSNLGFSQEAEAQLQSVLFTFTNLANKVNVTAADIRLVTQRVNELNATTKKSIETKLLYNTVNDALAGMLQKLQELRGAQQGLVDPAQIGALQKRLQALQAIIRSLGQTNVGQQLLQGANALDSAEGPAEVIARSSATVRQNYEAAAQAARQAAQSSSGKSAQGLAKGGLVRYFADGGFAPRGTDTVPAMLTPGEFVVNADASRRFYSQLTAMNSGRQPIYRATGGPVTQNFSFGDINLVNERSKNPARSIASELRRELRRSTSTL